MKFTVKDKETGKIVSPRNYYFVIKQNGELFTFNGSGKFEKADVKYEVLSELQNTAEAKENHESKALHISDVMPMFADNSNLGNEKRAELIKDYKDKIPDWKGTYGQGFADCFNWLLREYEKAN
jgi:hypothetical protein